MIFSPEDVAEKRDKMLDLITAAPCAVVTLTQHGTLLYQGKIKGEHFLARPTKVVDPTGAGDVFAAAFLIRLFETGDPKQACEFAIVAASLTIEKPGLEGIPTRYRVEEILSPK